MKPARLATDKGFLIELSRIQRIALLRMLIAGWKQALQNSALHSGLGEVEMTEHLRGGMRETLRYMAWNKEITVAPGTQSVSGAAGMRPDGLTDIAFYFRHIREDYDEHDPHAIVECKRVSGNDARLCRMYVVDGIHRFAIGQYASKHAFAFMAGYLLAGRMEEAVGSINGYIERHRDLSEVLYPSTDLDHPQAWHSQHARPKPLRPVEICHVILGFQPQGI